MDFALPGLDSTFQLSTSGTIDSSVIPVSATNATAVFYVKLSDMSAVFKFQTDDSDMDDTSANDVRYYVFNKYWPTNLKINPAHAMLDKLESAGRLGTISYAADKSMIKHDYIRYLAYRLFNTVYGVDLFNNERELVENIAYHGEVTRCGIAAVLDTISTTSPSPSMSLDSSGNKYLTNADSSNINICRELLRQIGGSQPGRLAQLAGAGGIQSIPFVENDTLNIKLTVAAASNQHTLTNVAVIPDRTYNIKLVMKNDITDLNTLVIDSSTFPNGYPYAANVNSILATNSAVYGSFSQPQQIPIGRYGYNGWYYTNSESWVTLNQDTNSKISWNLNPNTLTSSLDSLRYIRANLYIYNKSSLPFITIYTKATGSGDAPGGMYKSKRSYTISNPTALTNGTRYSFFINLNSYNIAPISIGHTNSALTITATGSVGTYNSAEILSSIAIETNAFTSPGNVEFTISNIVIGDTSGEKEYGFMNA
jgi:hypothetical protein